MRKLLVIERLGEVQEITRIVRDDAPLLLRGKEQHYPIPKTFMCQFVRTNHIDPGAANRLGNAGGVHFVEIELHHPFRGRMNGYFSYTYSGVIIASRSMR